MRIAGLEVRRASLPDPWAEVRRLFGLLEVDHVIDVGANVGDYARNIRDLVGFKGRVDCFEPQPGCRERLDQVADVTVHPIALGARQDTMALTVYGDDSLSSLRSLNRIGRDLWGDVKPTAETEKVTVPVERLDECLAGEPIGRRIWLKLDTQGFDLEVLRGASTLLEKVVAIQSEIAITPLYDGAPEVWDHLSEFAEAGFRLSSLHPITRVGDGPIAEADGIFLRGASLHNEGLLGERGDVRP